MILLPATTRYQTTSACLPLTGYRLVRTVPEREHKHPLTYLVEFPEIRLDYFRNAHYAKAPLACFLSHVHSDHLRGLESLKSPFIYCSAATREVRWSLESRVFCLDFNIVQKCAFQMPIGSGEHSHLVPNSTLDLHILSTERIRKIHHPITNSNSSSFVLRIGPTA